MEPFKQFSFRLLTVIAFWLVAPWAVVADPPTWTLARNMAEPGFKLEVSSTDATSVRLQWQPQNGANEYEVLRNGSIVGNTVAMVGYFTDFGLLPGERHQYRVAALDASGTVIAQSVPVSANTKRGATIRTDYNVLAIAFNPEHESLVTEETYLKHRIQFLELASLGSAVIHLYKGGIVSSAVTPAVEPGSNRVNYGSLVTRRDLPGLGGYSIVDLVEKGDIDHVWVVKSPVEFAENVLIGNRPIQGEGVTTNNTWVPIPVKCSRSFFVNAFGADERSYDAYSHMVEGVMTSISDGHPENWPRAWMYTVYTPDCTSLATTQAWLNLWERFRLADEWNGVSPVAYASTGNGNIGSSHFPPTARRGCTDYAYSIFETWQRYIDSVADDWLSFPTFSNIKRKLNGYDFGAFNNYVQGDPSYSGRAWDLTRNSITPSSSAVHRTINGGSLTFHIILVLAMVGLITGGLTFLISIASMEPESISRCTASTRTQPISGRIRHEYGTDESSAKDWGYWHSQNGFQSWWQSSHAQHREQGGQSAIRQEREPRPQGIHRERTVLGRSGLRPKRCVLSSVQKRSLEHTELGNGAILGQA